jgi:hypothetical protein
MVTYRLKGGELYDAISHYILSRGGRIISARGAMELRFELPAEIEDDVRASLELLGYAPHRLSYDLRLKSSEITKVSVFCLLLGK